MTLTPVFCIQIVDEPDDYYEFLSDEEDDMYHGDWINQVWRTERGTNLGTLGKIEKI